MPGLILHNPENLTNQGDALAFTLLVAETGSLAGNLDQMAKIAAMKPAAHAGALSEDRIEMWKRFIAREVFFAARHAGLKSGAGLLANLPDWLRKTPPFSNHAGKLAQFLSSGHSCAVALFPLVRNDGQASIGQAWAIQSPEADSSSGSLLLEPCERPDLEEMVKRISKDAGLPSTIALCVPEPFANFQGDSWQLALGLALEALKRSDSSLTRKLANDWVVTGKLNGKDIQHVNYIQEKAGLVKNLRMDRRFLAPTQNYREWPMNLPLGYFAEHLNSAWNKITGKGIVDGEEVDWPSTGEIELHQLVGGSAGVNIATPLLFPHDKLVLWHSDNKISSKNSADQISIVLTGVGCPPPRQKFLDSKSMTTAEHLLTKVLTEPLESGKIVIFNVTSGNRLMSYAVESLARRHPNVWLLYKDIDVTDKYTVIIHEGDYPATSQIPVPARSRTKGVPFAADALKGLPPETLASGAQRNAAFWQLVVTEGLQKAQAAFAKEKSGKIPPHPENTPKPSFSQS